MFFCTRGGAPAPLRSVRGESVYLHLSLGIVCFSGHLLSHRSYKGRRGTLEHGQKGQEPITTLWLHQRSWCGQRLRPHCPKSSCIKEMDSKSFYKIFPIAKISGLLFRKLIQVGDLQGSLLTANALSSQFGLSFIFLCASANWF